MPMPASSDELLDLLYKSELMETARIDSLVGGLREARRLPAEAKELAQQLVNDGVLTYFQASQLMKGRYRGFTLGKYRVLESIGSGGMANVYLCEHTNLKHRAAVKVVPIDKLRQGSFLGRFQREARAIAALQHPNIVRAYDLEADQQYHYLVMEFVDGVNLQRLVKRRGPLSTARAVNYLAQAAEGLQFLMDNNIVHRDIKPSNLMLDRRGVIKILDFGLTRLTDDEHDNLTQQFDANRVLGTVDYLAPEQAIRTHDVDIRADIYGLGVTGYFMLTGATPYQVVGHNELSDAEKLMHQQSSEPKPITYHRRDLPPGLVQVINRMMARRPEDRPQTPADVIRALRPWLREVQPPSDEEIPSLSPAAQAASTSTASSANIALKPHPVRPGPKTADAHRTPKLGELRVQPYWPPDNTPSSASAPTRPDMPREHQQGAEPEVQVVVAHGEARRFTVGQAVAICAGGALAVVAAAALLIWALL